MWGIKVAERTENISYIYFSFKCHSATVGRAEKTQAPKEIQFLCCCICDASCKWYCSANRYNDFYVRKAVQIIIHHQWQIIQFLYQLI